MVHRFHVLISIITITVILVLSGCNNARPYITVYTSVDRNYSEQIFQQFEDKTGIEVKAVYDTEASKTTGMVNRLIAEKDHAIADVYWSGEFAQTIHLQSLGVLTPYISKNSYNIDAKYKEPKGYWTAFGGRSRCIIVNTDLVQPEDYPTSFNDFLSDRYDPTKIGLAYPIFGTTATHAAALYALYGEEEGADFYKALASRGIRIVDGNGAVRDLVAAGQLDFGFTDTDDALGAIKKGASVEIILPDQGDDHVGTLVIPNTVALINGGSNTSKAKQFIDYLLSNDAETYMKSIGWIQFSTRTEANQALYEGAYIKTIDVTLVEVYEAIEQAKTDLQKVFLR